MTGVLTRRESLNTLIERKENVKTQGEGYLQVKERGPEQILPHNPQEEQNLVASRTVTHTRLLLRSPSNRYFVMAAHVD